MTIEKIAEAIRNDILALFHSILEDGRFSTNSKVGINTLADSNLLREAKALSDDWTFALFYNDYLDFIESGRRPRARKVPIDALIKWAKRKGIPSDNNTIYAIRESIYQLGIPPRPIMPTFEQEIDDLWIRDWSEQLFNAIISSLEAQFNG